MGQRRDKTTEGEGRDVKSFYQAKGKRPRESRPKRYSKESGCPCSIGIQGGRNFGGLRGRAL